MDKYRDKSKYTDLPGAKKNSRQSNSLQVGNSSSLEKVLNTGG